jgi:hypothetical protein
MTVNMPVSIVPIPRFLGPIGTDGTNGTASEAAIEPSARTTGEVCLDRRQIATLFGEARLIQPCDWVLTLGASEDSWKLRGAKYSSRHGEVKASDKIRERQW